MGGTGFFAAIVFVGFLAALRAAGFLPAALFFGAALPRGAERFATFLAFTDLALDVFAARFAAALLGAARFALTDFLTPLFLATARLLPETPLRFAARLTPRFAADFLFAAMRSPPDVRRGTVS